jgi:small subunit ribosomal protein S20
MANTSSAKKATRVAARRAVVNKNRISKVRSSVRKVEEAIVGGKKTDAETALKTATTEVMRGANKGVMQRTQPRAKFRV